MKYSWKFPTRIFLRVEVLFVTILAFIIFIGSYFYLSQVVFPILFAIVFLAIYVLASMVVHETRKVEEMYHANSKHIEISRKSKNKRSKAKIPLSQIALWKLDKFFHGGYLVTKKGKKHVLFFNHRKEVEKLEKVFKKHIGKKRKK